MPYECGPVTAFIDIGRTHYVPIKCSLRSSLYRNNYSAAMKSAAASMDVKTLGSLDGLRWHGGGGIRALAYHGVVERKKDPVLQRNFVSLRISIRIFTSCASTAC